jgi:hypothetical protein
MDLKVSAGNLDDLGEGTVAVSTLQAGNSGWKLGDDVEFWLGDGTPVKLRLVALYERGLGFGDVTLAKARRPWPAAASSLCCASSAAPTASCAAWSTRSRPTCSASPSSPAARSRRRP